VVYAPLGPTHLAIEDLAIMRAIPNMTVVAPCDAEEMKRLIVNFTIVVFTMSAIGSVDAAIMPTDLNSGDPYYLAFVTQGTRDAVSGDIADYN